MTLMASIPMHHGNAVDLNCATSSGMAFPLLPNLFRLANLEMTSNDSHLSSPSAITDSYAQVPLLAAAAAVAVRSHRCSQSVAQKLRLLELSLRRDIHPMFRCGRVRTAQLNAAPYGHEKTMPQASATSPITPDGHCSRAGPYA